MYCPKCGSATQADAKFCRACGADVSLVPMALTGNLPSAGGGAVAKRHTRDDPTAVLSKAIGHLMTGFAFMVVAPLVFVFMPAGYIWWFWLFIPAFALIGQAIGDYIRYRSLKAQYDAPGLASYEPAAGSERELPPAQGFTNSLPPSSVTEHTTRQLRERERQEEPR